MNALFGIFIAISTFLIILNCPSDFLACVGVAGGKAFALSASLAGLYAFWMGIIKILEKTPALEKLQKAIRPFVKKLFPHESDEVCNLITMNVSANILGIGGASTPLAISAITKMKEQSSREDFEKTRRKKDENSSFQSNFNSHKSYIKTGVSQLENKNSTPISRRATKSMLILFILNATSLQILPTTIISLRESAGSADPSSIILPTLLASTISTIVGVLLVFMFEKSQ